MRLITSTASICLHTPKTHCQSSVLCCSLVTAAETANAAAAETAAGSEVKRSAAENHSSSTRSRLHLLRPNQHQQQSTQPWRKSAAGWRPGKPSSSNRNNSSSRLG